MGFNPGLGSCVVVKVLHPGVDPKKAQTQAFRVLEKRKVPAKAMRFIRASEAELRRVCTT